MTKNGATIIEWPDYARVRLVEDREIADVEWLADVPPRARAKFHGGIARALPRYVAGATVLHASAVATAAGGLVVMGDSGAGKSTAAAILCRKGAQLLADDSSVIVTEPDVRIEPVESLHWLRNETCVALGIDVDDEEKQGVVTACAPAPVALRAMVFLEAHDGPVSVERIHGASVIEHLLRASLRLPFGHERALRDFRALMDIADAGKCYRVLRPSEFSVTLVAELGEVLLALVTA